MRADASSEGQVPKNPLLMLLARRRRYMKLPEVASVLAAVANMGDEPFTLKELDKFIPSTLRNDKRKRRSVSTLLETLVEIGYLKKPTERKWVKLHKTLAQYLTDSLFELAELERRREVAEVERKIIRLGDRAVKEEKR